MAAVFQLSLHGLPASPSKDLHFGPSSNVEMSTDAIVDGCLTLNQRIAHGVTPPSPPRQLG